jgi:glutathione S-transferase
MGLGAAQNRLILGSRRYSSWSLRGWLAVRLAGLDVEEHIIPLAGGSTPAVKAMSPSGMVPFLQHDGALIWDSLAILEYCAERQPQLWPAERIARAHARAMSAEMHSGFRELRIAMPMSCDRVFPRQNFSPSVCADVARIETLWAQTRARYAGSGPFLFGDTITGADVMYAPVVSRFLTYQPVLATESADYVAAVRAHPLLQSWYLAAASEPPEWRIDRFEDVKQ